MSRHDLVRRLLAFFLVCSATFPGLAEAQNIFNKKADIRNPRVRIVLSPEKAYLWEYATTEKAAAYKFAPPAFEIDGKQVSADVRHFSSAGDPVRLDNGATEYVFEGPISGAPHLRLAIQFQLNDGSSVIRFRYILKDDGSNRLTAVSGANRLTYLQTSVKPFPTVEEVELSSFVALTHSYTLNQESIGDRYFEDSTTLMGPIVAATDGERSFLLAYEHGSEIPDAFLHYELSPDKNIRLKAVKGNYVSGQIIDAGHPYQTLWFETAAVQGNIDQLASTYRRFVLRYMSQNLGTRIPNIFYNTWNFQERNRWANGKPYLESMNQNRILKEIDVAHRMGIDVFVLDTGWYEKTGDWTVSTKRFPDGLNAVKAKLDSYGMKLGIWFSPTLAAVSSQVVREHPDWRMSWYGKIGEPEEVWGTEKSYRLCMVSGYADAFADQLIRLSKELGVTYFKWDAIAQYGCNDSHHNHGGEHNTSQERADSYGFQLIQAMSYVADKVAAAVPGAIVDFDVTESDRAMGLAFLSSGKYFLINNGPYYPDYDVPFDQNANWNLFFSPGQARTWIMRTPLTFDRWIPSVLFLTHYFPDDPQQWQEVNVASLILGQNGIWGDLLSVSDRGIEFIGSTLTKYKQIRDDITESDPITTGVVSGSPEIHEKISSTTGRGAVVVFAAEPGTYAYITNHKVAREHWTSEGVTLSYDNMGRARIGTTFDKAGAKIVLFGAK